MKKVGRKKGPLDLILRSYMITQELDTFLADEAEAESERQSRGVSRSEVVRRLISYYKDHNN